MNKTQIIDLNIKRFFSGCVWDFKTYPDDEIARYFSRKPNTVLDLTTIEGTSLFTDIKDIFMCVFVNGEPYTYKSKAFPSMMFIHEFMLAKGYKDFTSITDSTKADNEWQNYWATEKGKVYLHDLRYVISNCKFILDEYRDERTGLDRNFWRLSDMNINAERLNKTKERTVLNFWRIENETNRELVKIWFKYQMGCTELSYSTVYERFSLCCMFLSYIKGKSLLDLNHNDIEKYRIDAGLNADRNNHLMNALEELYKHLQAKGLFHGTIPVIEQDYMEKEKHYIHTSVSDYTIHEIFKHLHTLRSDYLLIYLINVFTGIRISDICQLTKDCLYSNEHGYFLSHNCQKMQDVGAIPICKELYDMVKERITWASKNKYYYLFPSDKDKSLPYNAGTYRRNMKKIMLGWNIKNPDGTAYNFTTHAYRHTIATTLSKMGMPSVLIQIGILHHQEIDMSRHYIESDSDYQLELLNDKGINSSCELSPISSTDSVVANGYCGMPIRIHCDKINACLHCEYFRTSIQFLDVHEKHLENLNNQIEWYKANGYKENLAFAEKEKEKLELIINKLREIKGVEENENKLITATS